MRLAIIIINYRTPHFLLDCLDSLKGQIYPQQDGVIIIDNASGDGSDIIIEQYIVDHGWTDWVQLKRSPVNGGFSSGNNYGIQRIDADFYLLLNSDTIVRPGAIEHLFDAVDSNPGAGLISPRLEWFDAEPQESCFRHWSPLHEFFSAARTGLVERLCAYRNRALSVSDQPMQPDWVSFACVLIRRDVFQRIGLMDEGYFMYFDDMDFCRRAWEAGISVLYWPAARFVHLRGGSSPAKKLAAQRKSLPLYWYASRSRYYAKFYGRIGLWFANFCWYCGRLVSFTREVLKMKEPHTFKRQWLDIWTNALHPLHGPALPESKETQ